MLRHTPILEPADAYALWAPSYPACAHNPVMLAEERAMRSLLPQDLSGRNVLDAGCGTGRYLRYATQRGAARMLGVDLSRDMLLRADAELSTERRRASIELLQGSLDDLPVADGWADLSLCALAVGHLEQLEPVLAELCRATQPGGMLLCSDVHPIGHALGWLRDFKADGQRYAVRHTAHLYSQWHTACARLGLEIGNVLEPMLDPADIPPGAHFDRAALEVPVALVFQLWRKP